MISEVLILRPRFNVVTLSIFSVWCGIRILAEKREEHTEMWFHFMQNT